MLKLKISILIIFISSCFNKTDKEKETSCIGSVTKVYPIHFGRGYYKSTVIYKFEYLNKEYTGKYKSKRLTDIYAMEFNEGDSILISFNLKDPKINHLEKLLYIKSKKHRIERKKKSTIVLKSE